MSPNRIRTPAQLLELTTNYAQAREIMLERALGRITVTEADHDIATEADLFLSMSEEEYIEYLAQGGDELDLGAAATVTTASKVFDEQVFSVVSEDDTTHSLRGYKITDVYPGQIRLAQELFRDDDTTLAPSFVLQANVSEDGQRVAITKQFTNQAGRTEDLPLTPMDHDLVFRAASLLLEELEP